MKRIGFQFKVRQDKMAEYMELHKNVWPEMQQALRESGWHNYSLFIRSDGFIFGYFESDGNLAEAQAKMAVTDVNTRWQEFMAQYMPENLRPDETFMELENYFHLD